MGEMKIAILGAGAAGCTIAGHLKSIGHEIRLFDLPEFSANIDTVRRRGGINMTGELTGLYMPDRLTTDVREAVGDADIVMLTVPGFAHEPLMDACLRQFSTNQIVLNWTSYWSSLRFFPRTREIGRSDVTLAEASIMPYMTEKTPDGSVFVRAVKQRLWVAAMPASNTERVLRIVKDLYPQTIAGENVLWTSLSNLNVPFHAVNAIMNAGHWEQTNGDFDFFGYGITPAVARVAEAIDKERVAVAKAIGIDSPPLPELMTAIYNRYGATGKTMYDVLHTLKSHATWRPRVSLYDYGDVREDVPFGLVPLSSFGRKFGVPTPMIDSLINIASVATRRDFRAMGIDVDDLGVSRMTRSEILRYVACGLTS